MVMLGETILGIEGGGTKTAWALISGDKVIESGKLPPSNLRLSPPDQITKMFRILPTEIDRVGVFLAGCATEEDRAGGLGEGEDYAGQRSRLGNGSVPTRSRWHCRKCWHRIVGDWSQRPACRKRRRMGTYPGGRRGRGLCFDSRLALGLGGIRPASWRTEIRRKCFA